MVVSLQIRFFSSLSSDDVSQVGEVISSRTALPSQCEMIASQVVKLWRLSFSSSLFFFSFGLRGVFGVWI